MVVLPTDSAEDPFSFFENRILKAWNQYFRYPYAVRSFYKIMKETGSGMSPPIEALLNELKIGLKCLYGIRLRGIYVYGSYARDEADIESDLDLLVVLGNLRLLRLGIGAEGFLPC